MKKKPRGYCRGCDVALSYFGMCHECDPDGGTNPDSPNYDPSPWCSYGHPTPESCDCGPIVEND